MLKVKVLKTESKINRVNEYNKNDINNINGSFLHAFAGC